MIMKMPNFKQVAYMMSSSCVICSDGTTLVLNEEIGYLRSKLPFTCQHNILISSVELGAGKDRTELTTPRPGLLTLPDTGEGPNKTANRIRAWAYSIMSTIEIGGNQKKISNLRQVTIQLSRYNKHLRTAVDLCSKTEIKSYPDLEIINIDKFVNNMKEVVKELIVYVDRVVEDLGRLAGVEEEDNSNLEQEFYFKPEQAPTTRRSPTFRGKN